MILFFKNLVFSLLTSTVAQVFLKSLRPLLRYLPFGALQYLPVKGLVEVEILPGQKALFESDGRDFITGLLFWRGRAGFESNTFDFFVSWVRKSKAFIDVGANTGWYSVCAAALNKDLIIYAFEPHPLVFKHLQKALELKQGV